LSHGLRARSSWGSCGARCRCRRVSSRAERAGAAKRPARSSGVCSPDRPARLSTARLDGLPPVAAATVATNAKQTAAPNAKFIRASGQAPELCALLDRLHGAGRPAAWARVRRRLAAPMRPERELVRISPAQSADRTNFMRYKILESEFLEAAGGSANQGGGAHWPFVYMPERGLRNGAFAYEAAAAND
jgi:hypothetical protein